jgi:NitT/TauT family transport system substrate-binding protein
MITVRSFRLALAATLLALLSFAATALAGCSSGSSGGQSGSGAAATRTVLMLNWAAEPEFGGFYAAQEKGAFKRAGLDVEIQAAGAGTPVAQLVATGKVDFGIVGGDEVILARARGADIVPIFAVYHTSPHGIMVHASRGAKSLADVFSKGTVALDPAAAFALHLKKKYGFDKVKVVPYDGGVARFVADKELAQQCYITSEPLAARRMGADPQVFLVADDGYAPYDTVLVTREALWKEKPAMVKAFTRAVREGWRAYLDDPGPANAIMAKLNTAMALETFAAAAEAQKPLVETEATRKGKLGMMTRERWEALGKQLVDLGLVKTAPPVDTYLFTIDD